MRDQSSPTEDYLDCLTEEDLKARYLVPLLDRVGLNRDDLRFESSFSFRVGRQKITESIAEALTQKRPRLDILVTQGGKNLFVLEAKAPNKGITDSDRLQALSYARLVHPMPPFALVTNGSDSRLFETATFDRVDPGQALLDGTYEVVLPSGDDFDALECFLRLSKRNLACFCEAQATVAMAPLVGSSKDLSKKYIPELHEPRQQVERALQTFVQSDKTVLAIVSDSGLGKTCSLCHRALCARGDDRFVLFFRGSELGQDLVATIASEFAWTFAEELAPERLIRRLERLVGDQQLLIFVDAVDEWEAEDASHQLGTLAKHLDGRLAKLVISCKSSCWNDFLKRRGVDTDLAACVAPDPQGNRGLSLEHWDDQGFHSAIKRYRRVFGFQGAFEWEILEQAKRNPFFLRVAFEVAKAEKLEHLTATSVELYERYYQQVLSKTSEPNVVGRFLVEVAKVIFGTNKDHVSLRDARARLQIAIADDLPRELFDFGILESTKASETAGPALHFYFEGLRNYLIAFKVCEWQLMSASVFKAAASRLEPGPQRDAVGFYYRLASEEHKRALDSDWYDLGLRFIHAYGDLLGKHFPAFRGEFPAGSADHIGLVAGINLSTGEAFSWGVRALETENEPEVLFLPSEKWSWSSDNRLHLAGAGGMVNRLDSSWLAQAAPERDILEVNIARRLGQIVESGLLDERQTPDLARELLSAAVVSQPELLNEPNMGPGAESLPLPASRIRHWLLLRQYWLRFESELVEEKIENGTIHVTRRGTTMSYSRPPLTPEERSVLRRRCEAAIQQGLDLGRPQYVPQDGDANRLKHAIDALGDPDCVIEGPLFPEADALWTAGSRQQQVDRSELSRYVERFLRSHLWNYAALVAANFPTLKDKFSVYSALPAHLVVSLEGVDEPDWFERGSFELHFLRPLDEIVKESSVAVVDAQVARDWPSRGSVEIDGHKYTRSFEQWRRITSLFGASLPLAQLEGFPGLFTPLRDFTYDVIRSELPAAVKALGRSYGLENLSIR